MHDFAPYLLASSPAVLFTCKAGGDYGGTYVSENIQELLGYRPEEYLENSGFWQEHVHPDDMDRVLAGLEEVFSKGHHVCEYRFLAKNGEYRWMRDELRLVRNPVTGSDELVGSWLDITERKVMEENYRRFASLTSDYVHYCTRTEAAPFRIQWIDGAVNPISGYTIEDILAMGCWLPLVHPEDRQAVNAYLFNLVPGDRKSIEFRIVTKQQAVRWVLEKSRCEAGPSHGELILYGAVTDITERKRAEEALRDSESFLRDASRLARLGRWRWNILTNEVEWSTVTRQIFGLPPSGHSITYADFINAVHPDDRSVVETAVQDALYHGRAYAIEHRIVLPDGSLRHVQEKAQVQFAGDGKPTSMIGTVLDVTEQKLIEERLLENDRLKNEFIATASHELRTPLAIIQGYAELLLENLDFDPDQQREFMTVIHEKSIALEKIVSDLLDVSRVATGRILCLEFGEVDVVEEVRKVVAQFQKESAHHNFALTLPGEALCLSIDRLKIIQVLENLLSNAVKFSPRGSDITVRGEVAGGCFQIMIADQGPGIAPQDQAHVFEKFFRVDSSDTAVPGLGLGLYLVKKIIEAHRGRIWLDSAPGQGTRFFFTLPLPGGHLPPVCSDLPNP